MTDNQTQQTKPAGWYHNQYGQTQWWDGYQWVETPHPAQPVQQVQAAPQLEPLDENTRMARLNGEVANYARNGWQVQSVTPGQAVLSYQVRMGWFWNLILCVITGGLWLIYVIYRALNRKTRTMIITVDQYGFIQRR